MQNIEEGSDMRGACGIEPGLDMPPGTFNIRYRRVGDFAAYGPEIVLCFEFIVFEDHFGSVEDISLYFVEKRSHYFQANFDFVFH